MKLFSNILTFTYKKQYCQAKAYDKINHDASISIGVMVLTHTFLHYYFFYKMYKI